ELWSPVEGCPRTAFEVERGLGLEGDPLLRRQLQVPLRLERHVLLAFDVHLALRRDMDLRVGLVKRDLEVAVAADDGDARLVRVVEEDELVSLARDESATHHRAVVEETAAEIRRVLAVVEAADHERAPNIPELEGHQ